ncbi:MAG TPA: NADP-dependent oxidoreductase [Gammaproteobacteria bacterium]|nr:NADP-dependent oxidoreductase [Gammaproteobacteria bacterium]
MTAKNRRILFRTRPRGWVGEDDMELAEAPMPAPGKGELLVRNLYLSLDPYMRGMMDDRKSYATPLQPGDPMSGRIVGEVAESNHPDYQPGEYVFAMGRWEEYSVLTGAEDMRKLDPALAPLSWNLGVLGAPGLTAYVGMAHLLGAPEEGQQVYVSAAAGGVGQVASQLAKLHGARVVGSAGDDAKAAFLTGQLGLDAAFNYKRYDSYRAALTEHMPDGLDFYFDNVGGEALDAALAVANPFARFAECGMVSQYNLSEPYGLTNLTQVNRMRITMQGFIVRDHYDLLPGYLAQMADWLKAGKVKYVEDLTAGLENAPAAFVRMLKGEKFGKQVVQIAEP